MKRILSTALSLCLCMSAVPTAHAWQDGPPQQNIPAGTYTAAPAPYAGVSVPSPQEAYEKMIALKGQKTYEEGAPWDNNNEYTWKGGTQGGIADTGAGCVAFAYILSDAAFGDLPARMTSSVRFSDVKVGDILRVNGDAHTVIVLRVTDTGVVIAEGNYHENGSEGKIHWGRSMDKAEVEAANHYITRYPEGYVPPTDPDANKPIGSGNLDGGLKWSLTKAGTLTISGSGAMPDFAKTSDQPWVSHADKILSIVVENGVTAVGSNAFQGSKAISATIPASVKTIGSGAFQKCESLISATVSEGVESIGDSAFHACTALKSINLPASISSVGVGVFMECTELSAVKFSAGSQPVSIGDSLFLRCYKLSSVTLPKNINCIGNDMFLDCLMLSTLNIPQGAKSIGERAFSSCSMLTAISVPDSVEKIGIAAFQSSAIKDIYYSGSEAQWNAIQKLGDVPTSLQNITVHYNSSLPDAGTDPDPGPDPGHEHVWNSGAVTSPAGCTSSGVRTYTCTECGETRTETIPATGHRYGAGVVTKPATCTESGIRTYSCSRCGSTRTETISAVGHSYSAFVVTREATCTEDGIRTSTCSNCGDARTEAIPAVGHHYEVTAVTKEATCTEDGEQTSSCANCGDVKTEVIPAAGHRYGPVTITREATCTQPGEQTSTCTACGDIKTESIPAAGHRYGPVTVTQEATCTADGAQTSTCSACGDVRKEIIRALGHSFVRNDDGDYACVNERNAGGEPATIVSAAVADGYTQVRANTDRLVARYAYQNAASSREYVSGVIRSVLSSVSSLLQYTINTIQFTPPTQTADGEFVYTITLRLGGRAAAAWLTTEPLYMVIPADSEPDPDPIPDPVPDVDQEVHYISIPRFSGGEIIPSVRRAAWGDRVTLTVHPDAGYELSDLTVSGAWGRKVSIREMGDGRFIFTMPDSRVDVSAEFVLQTPEPADDPADDEIFTGLGTPGISGIVLNPAPMPFTDVPAAKWYYNSVDYVWKHYLMSGVSDTQFAPEQTTSRAMIWTILARTHNVRTDINPGSVWYERGQLWAIEQGVTDGSDPLGDITREQLAVMLWRDAGGIGGGGDLSRFTDSASVSSYAVNAIGWAVNRGILKGSNGVLNPKGTATRAEVAAMIMRYADTV